MGLGVSTFEYDEVDRVTKKVTVAGPVYYSYDLSGVKAEVTDPNLEAVQSAYDAAGRLTRTTVVGAPNRESYYRYDDAGLIARKVLSGDRALSYYSHDVAGRLTELVNRDDADAVLTSFAYQRNENGAVTRINHESNEWTYFTYDALDRLTEERRTQNPTIYGFEYEYDAASNRTCEEDLVSAAVTSYSPNALNLIASETTGAMETVYEYDQAQRMKTRYSADEATYFSHDQRGLPTKLEFAVASGTPDNTREFRYTGTGERAALVGELGSGYQTYLAYDGSKVLTERDQFFT